LCGKKGADCARKPLVLPTVCALPVVVLFISHKPANGCKNFQQPDQPQGRAGCCLNGSHYGVTGSMRYLCV
jgi:hypothetical protein